MGLLSWIKESSKKVRRLEYIVYNLKDEFHEISERNIALEKAIEERTEDLNKANRTLLTLNHMWTMMNSSQPLSNVLNAVVENLQEELGYKSGILRYFDAQDNQYFRLTDYKNSRLIQKYNTVVSITEYNLATDEDNIFKRTIAENVIKFTTINEEFQRMFIPGLKDEQYDRLIAEKESQTAIVSPINTSNGVFGCLLVFSSRPEPSETELNFLRLLSNQIELAIVIADLFETIKKQATTDGLTGLFNRKYFDDAMKKETERSLRSKQKFSLISLDLDHLKQINDTYGHTIGDKAIIAVADVLKNNARSVDISARLGGEEFSVLLPGVDAQGCLKVAERIRTAIAAEKIDGIGRITASIGIGTYNDHTDDIEKLVEIVDQAMYRAKMNGRNQVQMATSPQHSTWQETAIDAFIDILEKHRIPLEPEFAEKLCRKLKSTPVDMTTPKELLYSVADLISHTYTPIPEKGLSKAKVQLAARLAKKFELTEEETNKLKIAILMYDLGNTMLPEEILNKPEPLSDEERIKVKQHPLIAAREILSPITGVRDVIPIIEHHHENWNGSGYPHKKKENEIPISSQIVLIVDAFTAMTSERPYRKALSTQEAIGMIENESGQKWSPQLVEAFVSVMDNWDS